MEKRPINISALKQRKWTSDSLSRIPYWIYQDDSVYQQEQHRIYGGPVWNYLCLESDLAQVGSYRTTFAGEVPIVVAAGPDDEIYAFENRCAHRGALIALEDSGVAENFTCVYHAWSYSLAGDLIGVAFEKGVAGKGGMPESFCKSDHGPRKLRIARLNGLVFGSFCDDVPTLEDYLGEAIIARIQRVLHKPIEVIGRYSQALPHNWKLYFENVRDTYHASLLHTFLTTFDINRLTQEGGLLVEADGAHHVSYSMIDRTSKGGSEYRDQGIRSDNQRYTLQDDRFLKGVDEFGDGISIQLLSVFPGFVLAQVQNSIMVRQVLPKGVDSTRLNWTYLGFKDDTREMRQSRLRQSNLAGPAGYVSMEDGCVGGFVKRGVAGAPDAEAVVEMGGEGIDPGNTRATEAAVRGFWNAYRSHMGI